MCCHIPWDLSLSSCSSWRIFGKQQQRGAVAGFRKRHASFEYLSNWCNMNNWQNGLTSQHEKHPELMEKCEKYVCSLYGKSGADVIDVRYALFFQKTFESSQLSPTKDTLSKHISRANYQAAIKRRALDAGPDIPTPHGHGWILRSGSMYIDWMGQLPAAEAILKLIDCSCIKSNVLLINVPVVQIHWLAQTVMTVKMYLSSICRRWREW